MKCAKSLYGLLKTTAKCKKVAAQVVLNDRRFLLDDVTVDMVDIFLFLKFIRITMNASAIEYKHHKSMFLSNCV